MQSLWYPQVFALVAVIAVSVVFWPPKNRAFRRRGIEPGFLGLKVWPARIWFLWKGRDVVEQAYLQVDDMTSALADQQTHPLQEKDTPYLLQSLSEDALVLPPKYLSELRMLPGSKLSASEALVTSVLGQHSGVDIILKDRQGYDIARVQLTKSLRRINFMTLARSNY